MLTPQESYKVTMSLMAEKERQLEDLRNTLNKELRTLRSERYRYRRLYTDLYPADSAADSEDSCYISSTFYTVVEVS